MACTDVPALPIALPADTPPCCLGLRQVVVRVAGAPTCVDCSGAASNWANNTFVCTETGVGTGVFISDPVPFGAGTGSVAVVLASGVSPLAYCNCLGAPIAGPMVTISIGYSVVPPGCYGASIAMYTPGGYGTLGAVAGQWGSCCYSVNPTPDTCGQFPALVEILSWT